MNGTIIPSIFIKCVFINIFTSLVKELTSSYKGNPTQDSSLTSKASSSSW